MNLTGQLSDLIENADRDSIVALLAPLGEGQRQALAPRVEAQLQELLAEYDRDRLFASDAREFHLQRLDAAHLAMLGTGDFPTLPSNQAGLTYLMLLACASERGHQILSDRRPVWLAEMAAQHLEYGHFMWDPVWRLIMDGLIDRPATPVFLRGLARHGGTFGQLAGQDGGDRLPEMVRRDPSLIDHDLLALLDLPHGLEWLARSDERRLRNPESYVAITKRVWSPLLAALPSGHPVRNRMITGLLDVLGGDVGRDAALYHRFLTGMRPTAAEYGERAQVLLRLAGHQVPAVVSFAVPILSKLDKAVGLHPVDIMAKLPSATSAPSAATARGAVKLIASALRRQPELAPSAATALAGAFSHRRAEVQLEAVDALLPYTADVAVGMALVSAAADLAPSVAAKVRDDTSARATAPGPADAELAEMLTEADALVRANDDSELVEAIAAARAGLEPPAVVRQPWRDAFAHHDAVAPVKDIDELIEVLLEVVDREVGTTSTLDRALDGLAALAGQVPDDWGLRISPLVARVNKVFEADQPDWGKHYSTDFCYLVAQWVQPHRVVAPDEPLDTPRQWLTGRLREVALMLQTGERARLLALPTDMGDWIDPVVLAERVIAAGDTALARPVDVAVALARLAPWGRADALARLGDAPGTLATLVRAACGSDEDLGEAPEVLKRTVAWQCGPHGGAPFRFGEPMPDAPPEVIYSQLDFSQAIAETLQAVQPSERVVQFDFSHLPGYQAWELWHEHASQARYGPAWAAAQWPGDVAWIWDDPLYGNRMLPILLDPFEAFPASAQPVVLSVLGDAKAERRTLAADVLAQAIGDGRLTSVQLGAVLADPVWLSSAGRVIAALASIAARSALHRAVIARSLAETATVWCGLPAKPVCAALELLDEIYTADGLGLTSPEGRAAVQALASGRTKTATLAKRVLAHPPANKWPTAAAVAALRGQISLHAYRLCARSERS